jgi:curli biogenesis system outer membrane secretion channel CsgG
MGKHKTAVCLVLLSAIPLLLCCASAGLVLMPRERQDLVCPPSAKFKFLNIRTIAVLPFEPSGKSERGEYRPKYATRPHDPIPMYYHLENDRNIVPDELEKALVKTYRFNVADRRKLKEVIREMELQQAGMVDERTLAKIGRLTGADAVITGSVSMALAALQYQSYGDIVYAAYIGYMNVTLRMTHVETGEVLWVCSIARNSLNYIDKSIIIDGMDDIPKLEGIGGTDHASLIMFVLDRGLSEAVAQLQ